MTKKKAYAELIVHAAALIESEDYILANLANVAALLGDALPEINWAGFYLMNDGELILGPFWGKPACIHIDLGKGVCGTAAATDSIQRVADVHQFPGHISCDSASRSEIVLPIHKDGKVVAVLDIDSPVLNRFDEEDETGLSDLVGVLEWCPWDKCGYSLR